MKYLLAFALAFVSSLDVRAATIAANFHGTVYGSFTSVPMAGTFTYDDSLLTGVGFEQIDGVSLTIPFLQDWPTLAVVLTEADDDRGSPWPQLILHDGQPVSLDFLASGPFFPGCEAVQTYGLTPTAGGFLIETLGVPEPSVWTIWAAAIVAYALVGRRVR